MAESKERVKRTIYTTPIGEASYPFLVEPSTKFNKDGVYSVKLILSADDAASLVERLEPEYREALAAGKARYDEEKPSVKKNNPFKENMFYQDEYDADEKETGRMIFIFKMTASGVSKKTGKAWERKPALFDKYGKPLERTKDLQIWQGSLLRISFTVNPFYVATTGCGISLSLEAVQVLKFGDGMRKDAASYGFSACEDEYEDIAEPLSPSEQSEADADF